MLMYILLILLIPYQTHPLLSTNIFGLSVIKIIGFVALIVAFFDRPAEQEPTNHAPALQNNLFFLLVFGVIFSSFIFHSDTSYTHFQSYISFFIFNIVTTKLIYSERRLTVTLSALVFCIFISSLYIIKEFVIYSRIYGLNFRPFGGTFGDPNYFAQCAIMIIPLLYYFFHMVSTKIYKLLILAMSITLLVAIVFANSRGAFVGLFFMMVVAAFLSHKKTKSLMLLIALFSLSIFFLPDRVMNRFHSTQIVEEGNATGDVASTTRRFTLIFAALDMIKDKPIVGVGLGNFKANSLRYRPELGFPGIAHNAYLEFIAESGIPAFLLFISIIFITFADLVRLRRSTTQSSHLNLLSSCVIVSLSGFCVTASFLSGQNKVFWLLVFITVPIKRICASMEQKTDNNICEVAHF